MYIDSLTITALVVFVIALALFIRFCVMSVCGMQAARPRGNGGERPQARGL
ncbi:MAG: hypothetical protein OEU91_08640 [Gammaproteobacteria bacterium]|nr:hypothetical protein [Gammaproteobacteria bacterium]